MKKYKLIKEYPGSPSLNTTIDLNKEYWQEIVEKEYEVLSFRSIKGKNIIFSKPEWDGDFFEINKKEWEIYSVKRVFDKEIFTIGDTVECYLKLNQKESRFNHAFIIKEIKIFKENYIAFYSDSRRYITDEGPYKLRKIITKQKLLTTEDGVDIFEGDEIYTVSKIHFTINNWVSQPLTFCNLHPNYLAFSTVEKAEEYIIMNKPCLSINDLLDGKPKFRIPSITLYHTKMILKEFVKSKLNIK